MDLSLLHTLKQAFTERYGQPPAVIARAPGRLEVLGNHTDYNDGLAISCAIDRNTWFAVSPRDNITCNVLLARDGSETSFGLDELADPVPGDWSNYIKGLLVEMHGRRMHVQGFDAALIGDVPLSGGMSSSASLEMAAILALGKAFSLVLPLVDWARLGQACENNYVGANTGLLDQFTSLMGRENQLVHIDFRDLAVETIPFPAEAAFVVANSGVTHDLTQDYNERRQRCEEATAYFAERHDNVRALRDISPQMLEEARAELPVMTYRRAAHIVGENQRVQAGRQALADGDLAAFGQLLYQSHQSSRDNFENSCPELDILIELAKSLEGAYGARLSGGGFGGISIHLVAKDNAERYRQRLATAFETRTGRHLETMICTIGEGASLHV